MTVEPLVPDLPRVPDLPPLVRVPSAPDVGSVDGEASAPDAAAFARALDGVGAALDRAQSAEDRFANGRGSLHDAVYERARADVALAVATAAAQRAIQTVQSVLNMAI